jgi:transposase
MVTTAYLQSEAVTSIPWPAMSPDLNPIEHIWDMLGHRIQAWEPLVQNIRQLEAALLLLNDETWRCHPYTQAL